jgi:hypothetical protein
MQKAVALFLVLFIGFSGLLFAQDDSEPDVEPDWDDFKYELYTKGDQTFAFSFLGLGFPIAFINNGDEIEHNITPPIGGTGSLSYIYYINSRLFAGGELGLLFLPTIGENTAYMISLGARIGTQFILGKFEFPISIALGMTLQTYLDFGYFGFYMKGGVNAFFRATHEWSFGLGSNFCWFPQWTNDPAKNVDALFIDLSIVARYHF